MRQQRRGHASGRHHIQRFLGAMVRSLQRLKAQFLAHGAVHVDLGIELAQDADHHDGSSRTGHADARVHGLGGAGAFDHFIHAAASRGIEYGVDQLLGCSVDGHVGAHLLGDFQAVGQLVGDEHPARAGGLGGGGGQHADWSGAGDADGVAHVDVDQFQHVHHHGQRLGQRGFGEIESFGKTRSIAGGQRDVFAQHAVTLAATHEHVVDTVVVLTPKAIFAMSAGEVGLQHDAIADGDMRYAFADGDDLAGRLMPGDARIRRGRFTDASVQEPVQIAATNADGANLHGDLAVSRIALLRHLAFF